jgi:KDO2-lipid IV(A) lauroyltransferase
MARLILASALDDAAKQRAWLQRLLFAVEGACMYLCWYLFKAMSPERASRLGRRIVGLLGPRSAKVSILEANLRIALPERSPAEITAIANALWGNVGAVFGEYPHLTTIGAAAGGRLELVDHCGLDQYRRGGRRGVFFGAHLANWEIMGIGLARAGVPVMALYAPLQNEILGRLMARARAQLGCEMLPRDASLRPLLKHVGDGGSLGLLVDLKVDDGIDVPFFGHPMSTSPVPARLAARFGCDLVPIVTERLGDARYRFTVLPPLPAPPAGDVDEQLAWRTRAMLATLEDLIRAHPSEWLATNKRWHKSMYRGDQGDS